MPVSSGSRAIRPMRSPARPTSAGSWSTSGWKARRLDSFVSRPAEEAVSFGGPIREITSAANPAFKRCRDILGGPGIRKHGEAILAGARIRDEVLERFPEHVLGWLTGEKGPPPPIGIDRVAPSERSVVQGARRRGDARSPLLWVRVPEMPPWSDDDPWPEGCTLFVPFQDPENVGAVIRSAAAFGVARVVLLREAAHPFHPRSSRAAGPALFQVPLAFGPRLADLHVENAPLIALDTTGPELSEAPFPDRFGLVVGVEGPGLPAHLREGRIGGGSPCSPASSRSTPQPPRRSRSTSTVGIRASPSFCSRPL